MKMFAILSSIFVGSIGASAAESASAPTLTLICSGQPEILRGVPSTQVFGRITVDFQSREVSVSIKEQTVPPFAPSIVEDYTDSFLFSPEESTTSGQVKLLNVDQGGGTPSVQNDFSLVFAGDLPKESSHASVEVNYAHQAGWDDGDRGPGMWHETANHRRQLSCMRK